MEFLNSRTFAHWQIPSQYLKYFVRTLCLSNFLLIIYQCLFKRFWPIAINRIDASYYSNSPYQFLAIFPRFFSHYLALLLRTFSLQAFFIERNFTSKAFHL